MGKNTFSKLFLSVVIAILTLSCLNTDKHIKAQSTSEEHQEFDQFIKNKPYSIIYIWTSWCGISRNGLVNDYSKN